MQTAQRILLVDTVHAQAYGRDGTGSEPKGVLAAAVLDVCEGLARRGRTVAVAQSARCTHHVSPAGVEYVPWRGQRGAGLGGDVDAVIVLGGAEELRAVRRRHPGARIVLWSLNGALPQRIPQDVEVVIGCRSELAAVRRAGGGIAPTATVIPLPVQAPGADAQRRRLRFDRLAAAPRSEEALASTLRVFAELRRRVPAMELDLLGVEGAKLRLDDLPEGLHLVAECGLRELRERLRQTFCFLSLERQPEALDGWLIANAQALGTPALAFASPRVREVLPHARNQIFPVGGHRALVERIVAWRLVEPPRPRIDLRFELDRVVGSWLKVVDDADATTLGLFEASEAGSSDGRSVAMGA